MATVKNLYPADRTATKPSCMECGVSHLCLPGPLNGSELETFDASVEHQKPAHRGDHLFYAGDPFYAVYAIRSGMVKSYSLSVDGREQVIGFHLPGDLLGLDAIGGQRHETGACALETTSVCRIPFERLEPLARQYPKLGLRLHRFLSQEISDDERRMGALQRLSAEQRLVAFLLEMSQRHEALGYSPTRFELKMSRHDIGNYLGLTVETVSRLFSHLRREGVVELQDRVVEIRDPKGLSGTGEPAPGGAFDGAGGR